MKFIVGIGNPGKKYEGTRHNIGFEVVDHISKLLESSKKWSESKKLNAWVFNSGQVTLLKPDTYVNETGQTVDRLIKYHQMKPEELLVVSDDVNLDFGKLRLRPSGSAGGHHGLESVIQAAATEDFPRLRVGIRTSGMPKEDLTPFVLGPFNPAEKKEVLSVIERAAAVSLEWAQKDFESARACLSQLQGKNSD